MMQTQYRERDREFSDHPSQCEICGETGPDITRVVRNLQTGQEMVSCDDIVACVMRIEARQPSLSRVSGSPQTAHSIAVI